MQQHNGPAGNTRQQARSRSREYPNSREEQKSNPSSKKSSQVRACNFKEPGIEFNMFSRPSSKERVLAQEMETLKADQKKSSAQLSQFPKLEHQFQQLLASHQQVLARLDSVEQQQSSFTQQLRQVRVIAQNAELGASASSRHVIETIVVEVVSNLEERILARANHLFQTNALPPKVTTIRKAVQKLRPFRDTYGPFRSFNRTAYEPYTDYENETLSTSATFSDCLTEARRLIEQEERGQ